MNIDGNRLIGNLHNLSEFTTTPGEGVTRFSFSPMDAKAREYIIKRAESAGCNVYVDALQNIHIYLKYNKPGRRTVVSGSHIDTVQNGGWLDGIYGVCGALEAMETLTSAISSGEIKEEDLKYNYEMIIFAEEEGSNFGSTMTGSKFLVGKYDKSNLDTLSDDTGRTLRNALEALKDIPDSQECTSPLYNRNISEVDDVPMDLSQIKTMLELHIEQGPILDRAGQQLGIVNCIFGMEVYEVTLVGVGNHAGACPMTDRYDAVTCAAESILEVEKLVKADPDGIAVATIGKLDVLPNQSNVIPETVKFTIEVRHNRTERISEIMNGCLEAISAVAVKRGLDCDIHPHSKAAAINLNKRIIDDMISHADSADFNYRVMNSGAVHDACMLAYTVDTGMIFVPSINGRSHCPEENTAESDLIVGAQFLMDTIAHEIMG